MSPRHLQLFRRGDTTIEPWFEIPTKGIRLDPYTNLSKLVTSVLLLACGNAKGHYYDVRLLIILSFARYSLISWKTCFDASNRMHNCRLESC